MRERHYIYMLAGHDIPKLKKLVGSSSSNTLGSSTKAAHKATRFRSPPDKVESGASCKCWTRSLVANSSALVNTSHAPFRASISAAAAVKSSGYVAASHNVKDILGFITTTVAPPILFYFEYYFYFEFPKWHLPQSHPTAWEVLGRHEPPGPFWDNTRCRYTCNWWNHPHPHRCYYYYYLDKTGPKSLTMWIFPFHFSQSERLWHLGAAHRKHL